MELSRRLKTQSAGSPSLSLGPHTDMGASSDDAFEASPRPHKRSRIQDDNAGNSSAATMRLQPHDPLRNKSTTRTGEKISSQSSFEKVGLFKRRTRTTKTPAAQSAMQFPASNNIDDVPPASQPWSTRGPIWTMTSKSRQVLDPPQAPSGVEALSCKAADAAHQTLLPTALPETKPTRAFASSTDSICQFQLTNSAQPAREASPTFNSCAASTRPCSKPSPSTEAQTDLACNANSSLRTVVSSKSAEKGKTKRATSDSSSPMADLQLMGASSSRHSNELESDYGSENLDFELAADDLSHQQTVNTTSHLPETFATAMHSPGTPPLDPPLVCNGVNLEMMGERRMARPAAETEDLLADLPSDAFSDSEFRSYAPPHRPIAMIQTPAQRPPLQMTLFGLKAVDTDRDAPSGRDVSPHKAETPTHHDLDVQATQKWIYPMNLGGIRDYQYNIVQRGLFHNLLVALPTGLGKTFIAATIMLNWYRWTKNAQIVFVAPTKPLVSQQIDACLNVAGIPRSKTTMLTGGIPPGLRADEWTNKRLFFMTPQTLVNDLKNGIADPKRLVLLVVDEAHRATGNYAYVEIVRFLRRFTKSFRVLALTATPGNSVNAVQNVIDGLDIARIEIRTEFSLDIRQYIHSKSIDRKIFHNSEEILMVMELFSKSVQPVLNKLCHFNAFWNRDPLAMTSYGLIQARQKWAASDAGRNAAPSVKGMVQKIFQVLASLAHGIDLLKYHGITPFYHNMARFRDASTSSRGGKYEREISDSDSFQTMMTRLQRWIANPDFIGHPKLDFLQASILEHFAALEHGTDAQTRVMIFAHFRDSAEEIVRVLRRNSPIIRPHVFVGQASSKDSEGMDQKKQLEIIDGFKAGTYNTLVATSIGEEGLDIGEIDLIICYDSSSSPIRMLQRMGRTGRKRAGRILLLLMSGKEENSYVQAQDNYKKMQHTIAEGTEFQFRDRFSSRIIPHAIQPALEKRVVEIPTENSDAGLPEPMKASRKAPKRPPKRFNMPNGVVTGFIKAGQLQRRSHKRQAVLGGTECETPPSMEDVCLTVHEEREFNRRYAHVAAASNDVVVELPDVSTQPASQRKLGTTCIIPHGSQTRSTIDTLRAIRGFKMCTIERWDTVHISFDIPLLCGPDRSTEAGAAPEPLLSARAAGRRSPLRTTSKVLRSKTNCSTSHQKGRGPRAARLDSINAIEDRSSSPPATDRGMRTYTQGFSLDSSETLGAEIDEADKGSDLDGWLVPSGEESNELLGPQTVSSSGRSNVPVRKDSLESSGSSVPDLQEIMRSRMKPVSTMSRGKRKRRVIEDSDSD